VWEGIASVEERPPPSVTARNEAVSWRGGDCFVGKNILLATTVIKVKP